MKVLSLFILALGLTVGAMAQNKQILYGFEEVPQALLVNPGGKISPSQKMHIGIPLLSQVHVNGGSSGVSVYDIFGRSSVDINDRIEQKIFEMTEKDFFTATQQLEILSFGWRSPKDIYYSGGVYQEFDFISYFPRDLAILAWEGNANYIGYEFDLGQVSATADALMVYHFGANKEINKRLTVGARAKIYSSLLSARSTNNQGTFVTNIGDENSENIYEHTVNNVDMTVNTSGFTDNLTASQLVGRAFLGGNLGVGVDLGATYEVTDQITASASVLDVGAIFHTKNVESYQATGTYTLDGIELIFPPLSTGEAGIPYYDNLEDELEREIPIDTITSGYTQMRPMKVNAGVKYSFGGFVGGQECDCLNKGGIERMQAVGLQYYSIFRPKGPQMAGTLFYYRRLFDFLSAKATYTVDSYTFTNVGLGVATNIGKFNFYVAADNILRYGNIAKAKSVSLQLGFNIKFDEE
ncbi:DUF5723 family protein [Aureisphaera galaxeae]|uniref:DUF5723 family protein n=1 Tax=Aureisphaera galaxeae TaxID=1538023 RepID=UPI0023508A6E|nr:DUF5723 family protein [Aureisphaera galaxeae]MDC8005597.1 DUF5723 family protein [Aureisphaera galaxeae]